MASCRSLVTSLAAVALLATPLAAQESVGADHRAGERPAAVLAAPTGVALRMQRSQATRSIVATTIEVAASETSSDSEHPVPVPADGFGSSGFAQFMASPAGRILRVAAGAGMIAGGIAMDSDGGTALAAVGAVPLLAGALDFCILSPLFGGPFWGKDIRAAK